VSVYIIAEAGINHNGDMDTAYQLIKVSADAGADACKFQAFDADLLGRPELKKYELTWDNFVDLKRRCITLGVDFLCSAFDTDWLADIEPLVKQIKIPSSKTSDIKYIAACGDFEKDIILSTGLSDFDEIKGVIYGIDWGQKITILHCTTDYPPEMEDLNMSVMTELRDHFEVPVGYSDHTRGNAAAVMAVTLGATIIEKHITLSRNQEGPDHHMSIYPDELKQFVDSIRHTELMLGDGVIRVEKGAEKNFWIKEQYNLSKEK
jgi:sialic acid synthase SpsE